MLIRITGRAAVSLDNGEPVTARSIIRQLDGAESAETCSDYLDSDLADLGITGGTVKLSHEAGEGWFRVSTEYTAPVKLEPAQLSRLACDTAGQWSDGIGEACFDELAERLGVVIDLSPLGLEKGLHVEQIDDGSNAGNPKTALAKAARDGDIASLRKHLNAGEDTETRLQGYTPLHLAVIYGQTATALELIARGADVDALDPQGENPLSLAAMSNSIDDADAARVARALLERGASVDGPRGPDAKPGDRPYTPLYMAETRNKAMLATVLREFDAAE
jgi:hypothetical protein